MDMALPAPEEPERQEIRNALACHEELRMLRLDHIRNLDFGIGGVDKDISKS
jgi:hypothetical protein